MSETKTHHLVRRIKLKDDPYSKDDIMKLLRDVECSATLCCEFGAVGCHKGVLGARSDHLVELMRRDPCERPFFYVPGAKHDELQAVAHFMYHGEVDLELSKLKHFYQAVKPLQIHGLQLKNSNEKSEDKVVDEEDFDIYEITCISNNSEKSAVMKALVVLYDNEEMIDMTLACDDGSFKCHKAVVTACSNYVKNILTESNKNPVIFLLGTKKSELEAIIDLMYYGQIKVKKSDVQRIVEIADGLLIRDLSVKSLLSKEKDDSIFQEFNYENEPYYSELRSFDQYYEKNADVTSFFPNAAKAFDIPPVIIYDWGKLLQEKSEGNTRRSYSDADRQKVVQAVISGMSGAQASRQFGIPKSTVYAWMNKLEGLNTGISSAVVNTSSSGNTRRSYSDADRQKVVQAVISGMSGAEVSRKYDIPQSTVYSWMKKSDTLDTHKSSAVIESSQSSNSRRSYSTTEKQRVVNAVGNGMSGAEASRKYNIPSSTVYSWIKKSETSDTSRKTSSSSVDTSYSSASGRRSYTSSERQTVINAINNGMSGAEASRTYGIPSSTVYSWKNSPSAKNYSHQSNTSYGSSCTSYGTSNTSYGSSGGGRRSYSSGEKSAVLSAISSGMSGAQAARTFGIPASTVYSWNRKR